MEEPGDYISEEAHGYDELHRTIITPLRRLLQIAREIGVGVAHAYDAYG